MPRLLPNIQFIVPPVCAYCGLPFPHDYGDTTLCARFWRTQPFSADRAALVYNDNSKPLVLKFKHGDQLHLAVSFALWMARAGAKWTESALFVPVQLHWTRLYLRRYNQAALLCRALAKIAPHQKPQ